MKKHYVYIIYDVTGLPMYVGKGCGDRWYRHEKEARLRKPLHQFSNPRKTAAIRRSLQLLGKLNVILFYCDTEQLAMEKERRLIKRYGRLCDGTGILTNLTSGGQGTSGYLWNAASKRQARLNSLKQWSNSLKRIKLGKAIKKALAKPGVQTKINKNVKLAWSNPVLRRKQAIEQRLTWASVALRKRHSKLLRQKAKLRRVKRNRSIGQLRRRLRERKNINGKT